MCGAIYNVKDFPLLPGLLSELGYTREQIDDIIGPSIRSVTFDTEIRPTGKLLTLVPTKNGVQLMQSIWWLALDKQTLKPLYRWKSFNCRSTHIFNSKMHSIPPRSYRAIVLAQGFFEWQPYFDGGRLFSQLSKQEQASPPKPIHKRRMLIYHSKQPMLMAAMCKHWLDLNAQPLVSAGVITLPPHPEFFDIHFKSYPLFLKLEEAVRWLNPSIKTREFSNLFNIDQIRIDARAVAVNEADFSPIDEPIDLCSS